MDFALLVKPICDIRLLVTLLALVSLMVGCNDLREYFAYTRDEPNKQDLVGTYMPDGATVRLMRAKGRYDTSVETTLLLRADGNFALTHMPDWWNNGFGRSEQGFITYSGTWGTSQNGAQFWELYLRSETGVRRAQLLGHKPPYQILFIIGDPDSGNRMVFLKK